jgi:hypothetical protein
VNVSRLGFGLVAFGALGFVAGAGLAQPVPSPAPSPSGSPSGRGKRGKPAASPSPEITDSPPPPQFSTLDGVWEIQVQSTTTKRTVYSHIKFVQAGTSLSGYWERPPNHKRSPLTGTFDGRLFSLTIDTGNGTSVTMSGYCENFSDLVGLMKMGASDPGTAFTATHRKKERPTTGG